MHAPLCCSGSQFNSMSVQCAAPWYPLGHHTRKANWTTPQDGRSCTRGLRWAPSLHHATERIQLFTSFWNPLRRQVAVLMYDEKGDFVAATTPSCSSCSKQFLQSGQLKDGTKPTIANESHLLTKGLEMAALSLRRSFRCTTVAWARRSVQGWHSAPPLHFFCLEAAPILRLLHVRALRHLLHHLCLGSTRRKSPL